MKRISIFIIVLLVIQGSVCRAYIDNDCPLRFRTRWSMFKQGLISGDIHYSPYAWAVADRSGLVPGYVRYNPYAWTFHSSGLVYDCGGYGVDVSPNYSPDYNVFGAYYNAGRAKSSYACSNTYSSNSGQMSYDDKVRARSMRIERRKQARNLQQSQRWEDNDLVISEFLKDRNIDFRTDNFLRIDGRTVSVNFVLEDSDVVVKYWDPEQIQLLLDKPEYKQLIFEKYLQTWSDFCKEYLGSGGKICQIVSADKNEIASQLTQCSELNEG
jgi:hypothetical protein